MDEPPANSYRVAWCSHLAIEGNRPAMLDDPLWSIGGGITMMRMRWQGRELELDRLARPAMHLRLAA